MNKMLCSSALSIISLVVFLPVTLWGTTTDVSVWTPIPVKKGCTHLFVAIQEAEFVRGRLGEWLPKSFHRISDTHEILYRIESLTAVDSELQIKLSLWDATADAKSSVAWNWTLPKGTAAENIRVIAKEAGVTEVKNLNTGETRRIVLIPLSSAEEAQKSFSISRSAPLWKWAITPW